MTQDPDVGLGKAPGDELDAMSPAAVKAQQDAALAAANGPLAQAAEPVQKVPSQPIISQPAAGRSGIWTFLLVLSGIIATAGALAGGFIYGEYYGRHHAQFDNPALRKHYAGECYSYMSQQFSKTMRESFDREFQRNDLAAKKGLAVASGNELQEMKELLSGMQSELFTLRAVLKEKEAGGSGGQPSAVWKDVQRLIKLMEQNQIKMVADQCPASPSVPRRISSRAG